MSRRLHLGRLSVYIEPRDLWIGLYVAPKAVYVCPLPLLVFRWDRRWINLGGGVRRLYAAPGGCDDCSVEPGERHLYAGCPGNERAARREAKTSA